MPFEETGISLIQDSRLGTIFISVEEPSEIMGEFGCWQTCSITIQRAAKDEHTDLRDLVLLFREPKKTDRQTSQARQEEGDTDFAGPGEAHVSRSVYDAYLALILAWWILKWDEVD